MHFCTFYLFVYFCMNCNPMTTRLICCQCCSPGDTHGEAPVRKLRSSAPQHQTMNRAALFLCHGIHLDLPCRVIFKNEEIAQMAKCFIVRNSEDCKASGPIWGTSKGSTSLPHLCFRNNIFPSSAAKCAFATLI